MAEPLDVSLREPDVVRYLGELVLTLWKQRRQIEVLEARVDALDPTEAPDAEVPAQ
jgi:hypothetical protein